VCVNSEPAMVEIFKEDFTRTPMHVFTDESACESKMQYERPVRINNLTD